MRVKTEFQIYERVHRSGNKGWMVSLGVVNGRRKFKSFSTLEEAQLFKAKCDEKNALKNSAALSELDELGKAAIRHAQAKLDVTSLFQAGRCDSLGDKNQTK